MEKVTFLPIFNASIGGKLPKTHKFIRTHLKIYKFLPTNFLRVLGSLPPIDALKIGKRVTLSIPPLNIG